MPQKPFEVKDTTPKSKMFRPEKERKRERRRKKFNYQTTTTTTTRITKHCFFFSYSFYLGFPMPIKY